MKVKEIIMKFVVEDTATGEELAELFEAWPDWLIAMTIEKESRPRDATDKELESLGLANDTVKDEEEIEELSGHNIDTTEEEEG